MRRKVEWWEREPEKLDKARGRVLEALDMMLGDLRRGLRGNDRRLRAELLMLWKVIRYQRAANTKKRLRYGAIDAALPRSK